VNQNPFANLTEESFKAEFAQMTEVELARILRGRRSLTPAASKALDFEIDRRQADPAELRKLRPRSIDKPWSRTAAGRFSKEIGLEEIRKKRIRGPWLVVLCVSSFLLAATLDHFGALRLYWPATTTIMIVVFTVWGHFDLKGKVWFWFVLAAVAAGNMALLLIARWPPENRWTPGSAVQVFCTLELIGVYALIWSIERLIHRGSARQADVQVEE